jgi:hypothetical protein
MHRMSSRTTPFGPPKASAVREDPVAADVRILARSVADVAGVSASIVGEDR